MQLHTQSSSKGLPLFEDLWVSVLGVVVQLRKQGFKLHKVCVGTFDVVVVVQCDGVVEVEQVVAEGVTQQRGGGGEHSTVV